ncbi:F-box protein SKIP23-like [Rhododendron vialii]|uniref:F-box protein SKIP23-like n=1 Tax=Rhododendron vialii TaxID=182163 RepID=UPI00265EA4C8|nr:F-box protein SKIP23-like [Rhododendron vialii]
MKKKMRNWAELPEDLLVLTANKITLFEDFLSFSGVCRSWRSVAINDNFKGSEQIPWLMLSDKDKPDERKFVSLRKGGVIRTVNLPEVRGKRCLETLGWLVTIAEDGEINLLHPFTRVQINLPHVTTFKNYHMRTSDKNMSFIRKAVLSTRPEESKDYALVVAYGDSGFVGFWRPGDKSWTDVRISLLYFHDIIFHEGLFYGVVGRGFVFAFDVWGPNPTRPWIALLAPDMYEGTGMQEQLFIVEAKGVVLMVIRYLSGPYFWDDHHYVPDNTNRSRVDYRTCRLQVFQAALREQGQWLEITSLGDNAVFLGDNASVSVDASRFPEIKANCIYYTDEYWEFRKQGGVLKHTGIYCLEDGRTLSDAGVIAEEYHRKHSKAYFH